MKTNHPLFSEIKLERINQDHEWGGPAHDDEHGPGDWLAFIRHQITLSQRETTPGEFRLRMVKIAALAVAAIESHDRKAVK